MKLSKVNQAHKNMETTVYPAVTDFGPPRRRPGRMLSRPLGHANAVYRGPNVGRRPGRYKPNAPDWKAVHKAWRL